MIMKRIVFVLALVVGAAFVRADTPVSASKKAEQEKARWSVDDVILSESASGMDISPDCRHVAWVKSTFDKDKGARVSRLMRSSLTENEDVELTRGPDSCRLPMWSRDGKLLAFITERVAPKAKGDGDDDDEDKRRAAKNKEPKAQIWLMNPFGGEPWQLTDGNRAVGYYEWADAETIIFSAQEAPTLHEDTLKDDRKDDSIVVDDEKTAPPVRLFRVTVKDKKVVRLTDNLDRIASFSVSPSGSQVVAVHDRSLSFIYDNKVKPAAILHDLSTGNRKQIFSERKYNVARVRWSPDGKGLYVASEFTTHPNYVHAAITELYHYDFASGAIAKVDIDSKGISGGILEPMKDGVLALEAGGTENPTIRIRRVTGFDVARMKWVDAWERSYVFGTIWVSDLKLGKDGKTVVYKSSDSSTPDRWYRGQLKGDDIKERRLLVNVNPSFDKKTRAETEIVEWKGALNEKVEGILYYPHNYQEGKRYPLVLMIHGGPASASLDEWSENWAYAPNLMCQRGAFVLKPNYHGSSNYGLKFVESIADGKYYEYPLQDLEKGVDSLIARGLVDPDKLGTLGWSNGAILTMALVASNPRYKAASAGAGGAEWVGDWGACEFGMSFSNYYFGKSPLEDPQLYIKMAPLYQFHKVRTPTILFHGTEDRTVPTHDGWAQYRALQQHSEAEVRFVLFPGEKHGLTKMAHQRRKLEEELAWFDRHLFKAAKDDQLAYKQDSPLARALKIKAAQRDGERYGIRVKDILIPETVAHEGIDIGRFETTRAQFAQFDRGYGVGVGQENYPANRISFEQAKAYCDWLSNRTQEVYRLPKEDEVASFYEKTDAGENTLDYWAGHAVNPEDARTLVEKVRSLGSDASLLRPVGSFKGVGKEEMVFDLGGNVAEWVIGKDGKGKVLGGSADTPVDARLAQRRPAPEYVGFRVVKGAAPSKKP
jgi:dipeptidyl aminopeptidase/acylaminoacyl peptidase